MAFLLVATGSGALAQGNAGGWAQATCPLTTQWDKAVSPTNALVEYPRPQMVRKAWQNLNGLWDYALTDPSATDAPASYTGKILVPYCYESSLSGIGKPSIPDQRLWYHRSFTIPAAWKGQRILLHFGAVNYSSNVAVNGQSLGSHVGGYDGFDYDITAAVKPGANDIVVSAWNPLNADVPDAQVLGKQRLHPSGIFYTGVTGIWQTVWLEPAPAGHVSSLKITPNLDDSSVTVAASADGASADAQVRLVATDKGKVVASGTGAPGADIKLAIPTPHAWSPDDPHLYDLMVTLTQGNKPVDSVGSYFAMRKISLGKDDQGRLRVFLNNKFTLLVGALDQGYWPDGVYTAPTDDALRYDIQMAKKFGYNILRKHAKVEPERWYYWTDKLGMVVWQDMPQAFGTLNDDASKQWLVEWKNEIAQHYNHPSIVAWTTFNEGWGQHDTEAIVALTKQLDPTRLVDNASGWTDMHVGDIADTHAYPGPWSGKPEDSRAAINGEFGGVTMRVPGHMWTHNVFGYGKTLGDTWHVTQRYQDLLKTAYKLADTQGTSAFIYTQLTDVEQESNGIMTYDRAVVKPDLAIIAAANKGKILPLGTEPPPPPVPVNPDPLATSETIPQIWSYTDVKPADNWSQPDFDSSAWKTGPAPFGQGYTVNTPWTDTPGDIWIRRVANLPASLPAKLNVKLLHDEDAEVYVNGVLAASASGFNGEYVTLPMSDAARASIKPGKNVIAVHCRQTVGGQVIDAGFVPG